MRLYIVGDQVKLLEDIESRNGKVMLKEGTEAEVVKFNQKFATSDVTIVKKGSTRIFSVRPRQVVLMGE